jgi:hypothetical protein
MYGQQRDMLVLTVKYSQSNLCSMPKLIRLRIYWWSLTVLYSLTCCWLYIYVFFLIAVPFKEKLDGSTVSVLGVRSQKLSNIGRWSDGWPKIYYLELLRASEGTLSRWSRLYWQSLAPRGYDPLSLWVIHKEGLCPSSGDINRLMMTEPWERVWETRVVVT